MKKKFQLEVSYISILDLLSGALAGFIILFVVMPHHKYRSPSSTLETVSSKNIKVGQRFKMENIHFFGGSTEFYPTSDKQLDKLVEWLKGSQVKIMIEGHVSPCRKCKNNIINSQKLSEGRAGRIYSYLVQKGISSSRLKKKGYGIKRPVYKSPKNQKEYAYNRRVEFLVYSK